MPTVKIEDLSPSVLLTLSNDFIPSKYDLSLDVSPTKRNYSGEVSIDLVANPNKHVDDEPFFQITLHSLELISVSAQLILDSVVYKLKAKLDSSSQCTRYSSEELKVSDLSRATSKPKLKIRFLGVIHEILTFKDSTRGVFKTNYMDPVSGRATLQLISTHSQPHFARSIFPCLDELHFKVPVRLTLKVDQKYTCISNMPIKETEDVGESKLVHFFETPKISLSVFSFALGDLEYIETTTDLLGNEKFPIRVYTQVGESQRAQFALDTAKAYLPLVEKKFGTQYPLPKFDIVALPFLSDGGVEDWSMVQIISSQVLLPNWDCSLQQLSEIKKNQRLIVVHEMVHMYLGDYVTFDSYDYTWLNESFATFMADSLIAERDDPKLWLNFINTDMVSVEEQQRYDSVGPIFVSHVNTSSINDTFTREAYDKGIFVLRMLGSILEETDSDRFDTLFSMVGEFVEQHKYGTLKPTDLWNFIKGQSNNKYKYDIPTIMNSWVHTAGYPVLSVTDQDNKIVVEQHRFLYDVGRDDIEDIPYQIPLLVKDDTGKVSRQMLTDRNLVIDEKNLLFFNANCTALATVGYSFEKYRQIAENLDKLSRIEQSQLFIDLSTLLGSSRQDSAVLLGFLEILKKIRKINSLDKTSLNIAMTILANLGQAIAGVSYFDDKEMFTKIKNFLDQTAGRFLSQLQWDDLRDLSSEDVTLRNTLLSLDYTNITAQTISRKLLKKLLHGPRGSVPRGLLTTVLALVQTSASVKEYKEINKLVRAPGLAVNNVVQPAANSDVQTAAINSLGFVTDQDLRRRTLNFVSSNVDVTMVELALVGFRFQPDSYQQLWTWFKLQFFGLYSRFTREQEGQAGKLFKNVVQIVFECCLHDQGLTKEVNQFSESKNLAVLDECLEKARDEYKDTKSFNSNDGELKKIL
ncbi:DEKNAAC104464 [Brettanomyces naardenensis]|uniref:Aminopeptidase n=1 Tax=Brettanomyces naardenensis TaxID=13370 RepID=A0A448YRP0_BRENA|nr:DEKNAAC104464 [Brettanomyces naardenensis]